mgnify:CR=1 FL=1
MIKVGVELPDDKIKGVDLSRPELGNPGVGGSEYLFILLASELCSRGMNITVYHYCDNTLPSNVKHNKVNDSIEMLKKAEDDGMDILIHQVGKTKEWYAHLKSTNLKSIAWAHVYLEYYELKLIRNCASVKRIVFVGKEEYDSYIDDDIIQKATYIYNMLPTENCPEDRKLDSLEVTYVGSLVPAKGFHKLAEIWPIILKNVPEAKLNIIGNGKVYNRSAKLGKYGIAQDDYENSFMKYLIDNNGNILPSVHFWGIVGTEKDNIFKRTTVGIVNPTALTETFCMSAVEMEFAYIPVVSKRKWGLLDTVKNKQTGFLFKNKSEFINRVITLLNDLKLNKYMGEEAHNYVKDKFSVDVIVPQWEKLLNDVDQDIAVGYFPVQGNWTNDYKWLRQFIRLLRFKCHLYMFPSFYDIKNFLKKVAGRC